MNTVNGWNGQTPLHSAASEGHLEMVSLLVQKGAEINAKDKSGQTPMDLANANQHQDVAKLLAEN